MGLIRKHGRRIFRGMGILLVLVGLYLAYWWYYKLAPMRHTADPEWCGAHSPARWWKETQESAERGAWYHDVGILMGDYGDKAWAEKIIKQLTPDTDMGCFGNHKGSALNGITNQDAGSAEAWLAWWKNNKDKSQLEWIRDGFAKYGVVVEIPRRHERSNADTPSETKNPETQTAPPDGLPTSAEVDSLLTLLGMPDPDEVTESSTKDDERRTRIPDHVKYNAFRWLRDTGFDPVAFLLSNKNASASVERGVREYATYERRYQPQIYIGVLPLNGSPDNGLVADFPPGTIATKRFRATATLVVFLPIVLGVGLFAWSFRRR